MSKISVYDRILITIGGGGKCDRIVIIRVEVTLSPGVSQNWGIDAAVSSAPYCKL